MVYGGTAAMNPTTGELAVSWTATSDFVFLNSNQYPDTLQGQSLNLRRFGTNGQAVGLPIQVNSCSGYAVFLIEYGCFYPADTGYPGVAIGPGEGLDYGPGLVRYTTQGITTAWSEGWDTLTSNPVESYNTYAKTILPMLGFGIGHPVSLPTDFLNHFALDGALALDDNADLVAVWPQVIEESGSPEVASITLYAQVFDANGNTLGPALTVGPSTTDLPQSIRGISFNNGNFVGVWRAGSAVYAQRYAVQ